MLERERNEEAFGYYDRAEESRKVLGITDSSVSSVYFLKNRGSCLCNLDRHQEAVQVLKDACGIIEKLLEDNILYANSKCIPVWPRSSGNKKLVVPKLTNTQRMLLD